MNALQIALFRRRHRFVKGRDGVRCRCGWTPDDTVKAPEVARAALAHVRAEKAAFEAVSV